MAEIGPRTFLDLLKQSGLVEPATLKKSLATLSAANEGVPLRLPQIAEHLVNGGLITGWQRDKLLEGKHKGFFLGAYRLLKLLGTGGMSTVYLAEHRLSQHRRAIKVLPRQRVSDKSYLDRFYREGRAAASLNHPNIVRIYDLDHEDDIHFMVMEYVEGTDLQELVCRDGPLSFEQSLDCVLQAASGLKHAHERKIVHRDVKPSNLLAGPDGTVKVLDLGLALMSEGVESLTNVHNERVMGTADYLAPEQAINSHEVDPRADIYSLGCTLYFLLTGQPPFPDGTIAQRIAAHQSRPAPLVNVLRADCPAVLAELCQVLMRKSREDRVQSCKELMAEVRAIRAGLRTAVAAGKQLEQKALAPAGAAQGLVGTGNPRGRPDSLPIPPETGKVPGDSRNGRPHGKPELDRPRPSPPREQLAGIPLRGGAAVLNGAVPQVNTGNSGRGAIPRASGLPAVGAVVSRSSNAVRVRGKSVWLIAGVVGLMFLVLLVVLVVALQLVK